MVSSAAPCWVVNLPFMVDSSDDIKQARSDMVRPSPEIVNSRNVVVAGKLTEGRLNAMMGRRVEIEVNLYSFILLVF